MEYVNRQLEEKVRQGLERGRSILLLGARQTGKPTLLRHIGHADLFINFLDPVLRQCYEGSVSILQEEAKALKGSSGSLPLIIIDEVQKVPAIMDVVQLLIDEGIAQFILTGSSARK